MVRRRADALAQPAFQQPADLAHGGRIQPEVIYALLNFQSIPLVHELVRANLGIPLVYHFKESPFHAIRYGMWDMLVDILRAATGLR